MRLLRWNSIQSISYIVPFSGQICKKKREQYPLGCVYLSSDAANKPNDSFVNIRDLLLSPSYKLTNSIALQREMKDVEPIKAAMLYIIHLLQSIQMIKRMFVDSMGSCISSWHVDNDTHRASIR